MKKIQNVPVWLRKLVWGQHNCTGLGVAGERHNRAVHLQKKSVINVIWLLLSVSDWSIIIIGPGGLLLLVPRPICCPCFSFRKWGCKSVKNQTWMWKILYFISHKKLNLLFSFTQSCTNYHLLWFITFCNWMNE
jgi:hypothetical protein